MVLVNSWLSEAADDAIVVKALVCSSVPLDFALA
jgi:hypothetical protein